MEIGLREWLIVGAIIVIVLIIVDGWRRMRAQSNSLKIDIDDKLADIGDDNYNPELPLGTARVFKPKDGDKSGESQDHQETADHTEQNETPADPEGHLQTQEKIAKVHHASDNSDSLVKSAANTAVKPSNVVVKKHVEIEDSQAFQADMNQPTSSLDTEQVTSFNELDDTDVLSQPRAVPQENLETHSPQSQVETPITDDFSIDQDRSDQSSDIGFSAFDSDLPAVTNSPSSMSAEPSSEENYSKQAQRTKQDDDSFTVPDILKKSSLNTPAVSNEISEAASSLTKDTTANVEPAVIEELPVEQASTVVQTPSAIQESSVAEVPSVLQAPAAAQAPPVIEKSLAEQAPSVSVTPVELTPNTQPQKSVPSQARADFERDVENSDASGEFQSSAVEHNVDSLHSAHSTNVAAATNNTDSIVNNLLYNRAQSKQDQEQSLVEPTIEKAPFDSVLDRQEAVGKQAPSLSEINQGPDKFEKLLAERDREGHLAQPVTADHEIETIELDNTSLAQQQLNQDSDDNSTLTTADSSVEEPAAANVPPAINSAVAETAEVQPQPISELDEIEALKARLKALAPDEYQQFEKAKETKSSESESGIQFEEAASDLAEHLPPQVDLDDVNEPQLAASQSDLDSLIAEPFSASVADQGTTVIDDDVNLEDLDENIAPLAIDSQVSNFADNSTENAVPTEPENAFEAAPDPLMDGFKDDSGASDLMAQFEHDLEMDQQAVSNELDKPITEILKSQKENTAPIVNEEAALDDPLLASNQENELSESLLLGENFDDHSEDEAEAVVENTDSAGDLGFNAFDQTYRVEESEIAVNSDPLMEGFEDFDERATKEQQTDTTVEESEASQLEQKSLFNETELESVSPASVKKAKPAKKVRKPIANVDDPNAVLIVTVVAKDQYLNGAVLKKVVEACGMEFGDMHVFHRFEDGKDQGAVQFSMANAINPGTFNIDTMDQSATPGVSFFMSMDEPIDPKNALECMMATAETVATHLNGDLLDDERSVIRPQTKEHYRERVRIHEMNKLRQRAL